MGQDSDIEFDRLVEACGSGDREARDRLFGLVYDELRRIAGRSRFVGADGQTLQATALVNEAYIVLSQRLALARPASNSARDAFYATVGRAMRTILRDHWRSRQAQKRGQGQRVAQLPEDSAVAATLPDFDATDFLALDDAMERLEAFNPRWFKVVMHRYFASRDIGETAELLNISPSTVKSDWTLARAWLRRQVEQGAS
jgi:RNA polymerase sigma factor (TIGR02999 family)